MMAKSLTNNYIVLYNNENIQGFYMNKDLLREDIQLLNRSYKYENAYKNYILDKLRSLCCKTGYLGDFIFLFLHKKEPVSKAKFFTDKDNIVVINDAGINAYSFKVLRYLQRKHNINIVVHYLNCIAKTHKSVFEMIKGLNPIMILTDDPADAEKYGWKFWMDCLSDLSDIKKVQSSDVFFVGSAKDREDELIDIYEVLQLHRLNLDFTIVGGSKEKAGIKNNWIGYEELLSRDLSTNCILEVMQHGQTGYTCRAQEAIVFNKKLLTNNKWIINSKFYNSDFIHVFEKFGEKEIDFIKKEINVEYNYAGEFSPLRLIEYIDDYLRAKE